MYKINFKALKMLDIEDSYPFLIKHLDSKIDFKRRTLKYSNKHPYKHMKDACPVFDGYQWHLFGTADTRLKGDKGRKGWVEVMHAVSNSSEGPWEVLAGVKLHGLTGPHPCAPGVIYDYNEKTFYMYIHTSFVQNGGTVECFKSTDGGHSFHYASTVVRSLPTNDESRIYDPHPAEINGEKYVIYTSVTEDNIFSFRLARSVNYRWDGEWERMGIVLHEKDVSFQGRHGSQGREWGIEGAQLVELPNKKVLLNAVCFLPEGKDTPPGKKQRFFLGIADSIMGPYNILGPVLSPTEKGWEAGENGHATVIIEQNEMKFFYHARGNVGTYPKWKYGVAKCDVNKVIEYTY